MRIRTTLHKTDCCSRQTVDESIICPGLQLISILLRSPLFIVRCPAISSAYTQSYSFFISCNNTGKELLEVFVWCATWWGGDAKRRVGWVRGRVLRRRNDDLHPRSHGSVGPEEHTRHGDCLTWGQSPNLFSVELVNSFVPTVTTGLNTIPPYCFSDTH